MNTPRQILVAMTLLALVVAGCGQSEDEKRAAEDKRVAAEAKEKAAKVEKDRLQTADLCADLVGDLSDALGEVNSRLDVGMRLPDYTTALGDVKVAYDKTDWDSTPNQYCLTEVAIPLEDAFQAYIDANQTWNDCIGDYDCDYDADAQPKIQKKWSKASELLNKSAAALADFKLDSETSE